jgi:excinuclease ABC subunit C
LPLIKQAVKLKFGKQISISASINSNIRKVAKLGKLNANQVIENRVNQADKYSFAIKDLILNLGLRRKNITIEGFDISHHGGKNAVASAVRFSSHGPEKNNYRLFNIPDEFSGNDIGSMRHVLERRINKKSINPLPDIILIDGGKLQLDVALSAFSILAQKSPMILSIVKGSKRVRATETILSKMGLLKWQKIAQDFCFFSKFEMSLTDLQLQAIGRKKISL